jgi:hypothetical protein
MTQTHVLPGLGHLPGSDDAIGTGGRQLRSVWTERNLVDDIVEAHRHPRYLVTALEGPDTRGSVVAGRRHRRAIGTPGEALGRVIQGELKDVGRTWHGHNLGRKAESTRGQILAVGAEGDGKRW